MSISTGFTVRLAAALLAAPLFLHLGAALAGEALSGDKIKALVSDATVEGKMNDGMAYAEYYDADGTIKGKDYTGKWTVEGDSMCFVYGADPKKCYQIGETADGIEWMLDGKVDGTGKVTKGNVKNF